MSVIVILVSRFSFYNIELASLKSSKCVKSECVNNLDTWSWMDFEIEVRSHAWLGCPIFFNPTSFVNRAVSNSLTSG